MILKEKMALIPTNQVHLNQISAGTIGRNTGHKYEDDLAAAINNLAVNLPLYVTKPNFAGNIFQSNNEAVEIINFIASYYGVEIITVLQAIPTGKLATAGNNQSIALDNIVIKKTKSDILININNNWIGISVKHCGKKTPTNAQVYFTTASRFCSLLRENGIPVSLDAEIALKQFCGDVNYNPIDNNLIHGRLTDPRRYFWEEINVKGKNELENTFSTYQDIISRLLLQKAYKEDLYPPSFLIHKTKAIIPTEIAIYTIDEIIQKSAVYQDFNTEPYRVNKGSYRDPQGITHEAPRFGIFQMQRAGNKQHPTQLQFNLKAGYFYHLANLVL